MARKRRKIKDSFFGIQVKKWITVIFIGAFLYFAYQEDFLREFLQLFREIIEEKKISIDQGQDTKKQDDFIFPTPLANCQVIRQTYFTLCYDEKHEQPAWVAYVLLDSYLEKNTSREGNQFKPDEKVSTGSALPSDYTGSGYDRGHLAPAADFQFSQHALDETFFMSNISPQDPQFNRGIWSDLEQRVRFWAKKEKQLHIITGAVLKNGLPRIGKKNKISVPEQFYKIILDLQEPEIKAIAFLMENEGSQQPLQSFVVSIDEIERITGIDFFHALPDELENRLEASIDIGKWFKSRR